MLIPDYPLWRGSRVRKVKSGQVSDHDLESVVDKSQVAVSERDAHTVDESDVDCECSFHLPDDAGA